MSYATINEFKAAINDYSGSDIWNDILAVADVQESAIDFEKTDLGSAPTIYFVNGSSLVMDEATLQWA